MLMHAVVGIFCAIRYFILPSFTLSEGFDVTNL